MRQRTVYVRVETPDGEFHESDTTSHAKNESAHVRTVGVIILHFPTFDCLRTKCDPSIHFRDTSTMLQLII